MPIKKESCRISERSRMKQMNAEGYSVEQIANAVSVKEHIVQMVIDGTWDKGEEKQKKAQKSLDEARATEKERQAAQERDNLAAAVTAGVLAAQEAKSEDAA